MAAPKDLIPSDYLRAVSPDVAEPFFRMRDAAKNLGPLDQTTYELILLTGLAILNHEEVFKVHATRARSLGIPKQALQHAMLVMLGDQPLVGPDIIDALLAAYAAGPHGLVAPTYGGRRGNPVIIDRRYFAELLALPPEAAPRALLQHHPDDLLLVEVESDAILHDLDRPEDYERLRPHP